MGDGFPFLLAMPRGAKPSTLGRPQTLREARRAYQKAGRTPSFTAAQIRAADRATEADKRAKEILSKEKRAREAKRRKEVQEVKQREQQRKLVEKGKLPEESLWGKVRSSQQRLHNFFGAPEPAKAESKASHKDPENLSLERDARSATSDNFDDEYPDLGWVLSAAPAAMRSLEASRLPLPRPPFQAPKLNIEERVSLDRTEEQGALDAVPGTQAQRNAQMSFSGRQLFSELDNDKDLEAEFNGSRLLGKKLSDPGKLNYSTATSSGTRSRKREAYDVSPLTPPSAKHSRLGFARRSPSMLNARARERPDISANAAPARPVVHPPRASLKLEDIPTASQVEALFKSQDFDDDNVHSDKENLSPCRASLANQYSTNKTYISKSLWAEARLSPLSTRKRPTAKESSSGLRRDTEILVNAQGLHVESEDEFGGDDNDEFSELALQIFEVAKYPSQQALNSAKSGMPAAQRFSSQKQSVICGSPSRSRVRELPNGTQDSFYDPNGVDDEDLAGLADNFSSSQKLIGEVSLQKSSRPKSGRSIPWATSTPPAIVEEKVAGPDM
jgi:hypothetical protein